MRYAVRPVRTPFFIAMLSLAMLCLSITGCAKQAEPAAVKAPLPVPENPEPGKPRRFTIETPLGNINVELFDDTPKHRDNFAALVGAKYYDGTTFHRVIPGFMIQGGDPNSRNPKQREMHGQGGPEYTVPAEIKHPNQRGTLAAARQGDQVNPMRASSGSQFFINAGNNTPLDGGYTVFGRVTDSLSMVTVDKIIRAERDPADNPLTPIPMTVRAVK